MKTNKLYYAPTKFYKHGGKKYKISAVASLNDDCHNMTHHFSITGDIYEEGENNRWEFCSGGCIHDEIVKHFPELKKYIPLHCSNYLGQPSYPEANGQYHIRRSTKEVAMSYLRCSEQELSNLFLASHESERPYFKYLLFKLGLVARWKEEADEFIAFLEQKMGKQWENPYKPEEERFVLRLSDEEQRNVELKITEGFYLPESIAKRQEERVRLANEKIRNEVLKEYEEKVRKAKEQRDVMLYIFDNGLPIDNVIYYDHSKEVVFNWMEYRDKISKEQFDEFVNKLDYSRLPEGIKFYFGKKNKKT